MRPLRFLIPVFCVFAVAVSPLWAQFNPERAYRQSDAVRQHYPDPAVRFGTPAFAPGKADFTSHAEMMDFIYALQRTSSNVHVRIVGASQEGRAIPMLILSNSGLSAAADLIRLNRPIVFLQGLQHGNEPAGGEVMLALAKDLANGPLKPLLDRITVIIMPRCNPDGAFYFTRTPARGIDVNRDHIKMDLPETIALHRAINEFQPEVFVDAHEFSVATRWLEKFNKILAYDLTLLYATNPNVPAALTALAEGVYRRNIVREVERAGYTHFWYFTTSYDPADKKVAMGGTSPDIGRNTSALQNAISFLIETRGVGIGRAHYKRRVYTHLVAMHSMLDSAAANAEALRTLGRTLRHEVSAAAGHGDLIVLGASTPGRHVLDLLDPETGADKSVEVDWRSALEIQVRQKRARPFGYLLPATEANAARRLAQLGVTVLRLTDDAPLAVERYRVTRAEEAKKEDVRRNDEDAGGSVVQIATVSEPARVDAHAGDFYVPLDQPLGNVIAAALEPDTQSSYAANRVLNLPAIEPGYTPYLPLYRVPSEFPARMTVWEGD